MIRSAFLAITLLLCGVAVADPSTSPHDPTGHGIEQHDELMYPLFCAASYVVFYNQISLDPTVPSTYKMGIKTRMDGLVNELDRHVTRIGHNDERSALFVDTLIEATNDLAINHTSDWLLMVETAQCKQRTEKYVKGFML